MWNLNHQRILAISCSYLHQDDQLFEVGGALPCRYQAISAQTKIKGLGITI